MSSMKVVLNSLSELTGKGIFNAVITNIWTKPLNKYETYLCALCPIMKCITNQSSPGLLYMAAPENAYQIK